MEEKILNELKSINMQLHEFDSKLKALNEKICTEFDVKLNVLERKFIDDSSEAFKENINFLYEMKNKAHEEMLNELRDHKVRTLKGVKAFERALTAV